MSELGKLGKLGFLVLFIFSLAGCTGDLAPAGSTVPLETESVAEDPVVPVRTGEADVTGPSESELSSSEEAPKLSGTWNVKAASGDQPSTREKARKMNLLWADPLALGFNFSTGIMNLRWTAKPHAVGEVCEMRMTFTAVRSKKHCGCPLVSFKLTKGAADQLFHPECLVQVPSEIRPGTPEELLDWVRVQLEGTYQIVLDEQNLTLIREESEGASLQIELQGSL